jgi:hypothetical protein
MVFVMGFHFKLLEDASLRTVFFILFPDNCTQQPNKLTRARWVRDCTGRGTGGERRGNAGGAVFDRSGGSRVGRGERINKIDAFIKLIIILAGLSI